MAFEFYRNQTSINGHEPGIPGFLLSNEQMFWVALQVKKCFKGKTFDDGLKFIFSKTSFAETFNCSKERETDIVSG